MKLISLTSIPLKLRLWLDRIGCSNVIAFVFCLIGFGAWLCCASYLKQQRVASEIKLQQIQIALNQAPKAVSSHQLTESEQRLKNFYSTLGDVNYVEQQVASLFALANKNNLTLNQADYKLAKNNNGHFHTYTVTFAMQGQYSVIRQFGEQVLRSIPFTALDELSFKRTSIANHIIETRLRLTFYLSSAQNVENSLPNSSSKQGV
jgi:hypothetical protein